MNIDKKTMCLYAVTDRMWLGERTLEECVEQAILGGVTLVQLREKNMPDEIFLKRAEAIKKITDKYCIPLIINDNIDIMLACGAAGVHVGQQDMRTEDVRQKVGPKKIIGVSAHSVEEAIAAQKAGADYLGVGAAFGTSTKKDAGNISLETITQIVKHVSIPVVAIGGINEKNIGELRKTGVDGAAVVSAIFAKNDILSACQTLKSLFLQK